MGYLCIVMFLIMFTLKMAGLSDLSGYWVVSPLLGYSILWILVAIVTFIIHYPGRR